MAGIGFELRRYLDRDDYQGLAQAYGLACVLGAGPWLLSSAGILIVGDLALRASGSPLEVARFLVSVTYLMATSLILTGGLQFLFTRFVADRIYEKRHEVILPNLMGAILVMTVASGLLGAAALALFFDEPPVLEALLLSCFVLLCDLWLAVVFVSSLKRYRLVLWLFALAYAVVVGGAVVLLPLGAEGLLAAFFVGHATLFFALLAVIAREIPGERLVAFDFLSRRQSFRLLAVTGLACNLALWVDKIIFWICPSTSEASVGPLRFSPIHDLPVFLASLSMIPGMAVFLLRVETDFAGAWERFYDAIRKGRSLGELEAIRNDMVVAVRRGLAEIFKVQGVLAAILFLAGAELLAAAGLSPHHVHLFRVSVVGHALFVGLLAVLNVLLYLDKRMLATLLVVAFGLSSAGLTALSLILGPPFYGYGFATAALIALLGGILALDRKLEAHEYETFMLQP